MNLDEFQGATCTAVAADGSRCTVNADVFEGVRQDSDAYGFAVYRCVFSCEDHWWLDIGQGEYEMLVRIEGGDMYFATMKALAIRPTKVYGETVEHRIVVLTRDGTYREVEKAWTTMVNRRHGRMRGIQVGYFQEEPGQLDLDMPVALEYDKPPETNETPIVHGATATCTYLSQERALCGAPAVAANLDREAAGDDGFVEFSCVFACAVHWIEHEDHDHDDDYLQ